MKDQEGKDMVWVVFAKFRNWSKKFKKIKKSKRLDNKYFLTIHFLTETTENCANFVDALLGRSGHGMGRFCTIQKLVKNLTVVPPYRETIFWPSRRSKKVVPFRTRALGTHITAFRATCTRYFNNFMAHYLQKIARSVSRHPIMRFNF